MNPFQLRAKEFRLGYAVGVYAIHDVVKWADDELLRSGYNDDLANIALASNVTNGEMISLLNRICVPDLSEEWCALRRVMGRMHDFLLNDDSLLNGFVKFLDRVGFEHKFNVPSDMNFLLGINDEYELAEKGIYGTIEYAKQRLILNLQTIKNRLEDNQE